MATAKDYTNAMLNALDVYVENATNSLKLDKTITVTITGCTNSDNRQYTCSYNGGTLTVYAYEGSTYSVGDDVFVLVPQNDFSKKKYITGIATTEASSSSSLSNKNLYNYIVLNNNSVSTKEAATLDCATEDYAYLYVKQKAAIAPYLINGKEVTYEESGRCVDCVQVKEAALQKNLSDQNVGQIALVVSIQTESLQLQHKQGRYGIIVNTVCTDTSQMDSSGLFVNKTVSYEINSNNMSGNPFAYNNPSTQYIIFDSLNDRYTFQYIKDIIFYCDGFTTGSVSLNKIQLLCLNQDIQTSADSDFTLYITSNGKNCFTTFRSDDQITLTAVFKEKSANRSQEYKATYYWGIKDTTITSDNTTYYNEKLGEGWRYVAGGRGDQEQYKYTTTGSQNTESATAYKLVAEYQTSDANTVSLSSQYTLYNLANSIQTKIESSSGKIFNFKGATTLTCTINGKTKNYIEGESDSVFAFSWNRTAKRESASATGTTTQLAQNQKSNTLEVNDLVNLTEKYVEYTCCVTKNGFTVGTASIILRNSETWNTTGTRVEIINGSQLFQYDERGKSPTLAATPQVISPLYARFYDSQGNKIYDSSTATDSSFSVQWRIPAKNSLIKPPSNAVQDNDSNYMILTGRSCSFTIEDSYSASLINNQIQVAISDLSTDEVFSQETNFTFTKIGLNGTNGTANAVTIIPREDYDMENNAQLALITIDEEQADGTSQKRHFWNAIKSYTYNEDGKLVTKTYAGENSPILQPKVFINGSQYTDFSSSWYPAGNNNSDTSLHMTFSSGEEDSESYGIVKYSEEDNEFNDDVKDRYKTDIRIACAEIGFNDSTVYDYYPIPTIEYQNDYTFEDYPITILQNKYLRNVYYSSNGSMAADPTYSQDQGAFYKINTTKPREAVTAYTKWSVTGGLNDKTPELRLNTAKGAATGNKEINTYQTALMENAKTLAETIQNFVKNYSGDTATKNYLASLMNKANLIISQSGVNWNIKINNLKTECDSWIDTNSQDANVKLYADDVDVKILRNYYLKLYDSYRENSVLINASSEQTEKFLTEIGAFLSTSWPNFCWDFPTGIDWDSKSLCRLDIQKNLGAYIDSKGVYVGGLQDWGAYTDLHLYENSYLTHSEFYELFKNIFYKKKDYENESIQIIQGADNEEGYITFNYYKNNVSVKELNSCFLIWIRGVKKYIDECVRQYEYVTINDEKTLISNARELAAYYDSLMDKWIAEIGNTRTVVTGTHTVTNEDGTTTTVSDTAERWYYQYDDGTDLSIEKLNEKYQAKWNSLSAYMKIYGARAARDTLTNYHIDLDSFLRAMQSTDEDITDGIYIIPPEQCTAIMCNNNVVGEVHATITQDGKEIAKDVVIAKITFPVHLGLNTYELRSLNGWDGQSIELNDKENYIIAPQIAAGVKDSLTNHFTGIVMGAVTNPTEDGIYDAAQNIGLLGYAQGEQSIFLDAKTGSATFGLLSEDEGEGRIQLVPGGVSSIGGWRIGNKFLANINDGEYELRTDPDLRSIYYDENNANTYQKVRIPNDKGGIVLSADKPYIHVKSNPYTMDELGETPSVESDTINQLGLGDSLEVKVDPNNNSVFSIVQHTANHQVALQDNLYYGTLKKDFVKPFSVGVDEDYDSTEILYTYQYDLTESGAVKSYNNQAGLMTISKVNPYSQIYGSYITRMHDDNIVSSISRLISENNTSSATGTSNVEYDLDGTNIAGGSFNPSTGALTIKLNDSLKSQAKVNYASDQFINGVLDYNDTYYARWLEDGTSFVVGGQVTVEPVNYVGPIKYTWTIYDPDWSNADHLTITSYQNQLKIGSDRSYVGCYVEVRVTDEGLTDENNPNGKSYILDSRDLKSWNEAGTDYGSYNNTIQDDEELTETIEYAAFGDYYYGSIYDTDDDDTYKKCSSAIQVIEKYEAVDENTEGYSVYDTYDLTQADFTEQELAFPEVAADDTRNWVVRWKSTVSYVNHVFMPDYKIGYLNLLSYVIDGLKIRATICLVNSTFKDFKSAGVGLTMKIVEASDPSKVYYSEKVTDWTGSGGYTECLFTFEDEVEEGYYQVFLHLQDEDIASEEWEETIVYEVTRKRSPANGDPYFTLRIIVENESNVWDNSLWTNSISQGYCYGQIYVGDAVASCLVGGATKTGLYYEKELNINDGTDTAKAAHALSMTTSNFIRIYSTYKDLIDTSDSDTYSVCTLTEEKDDTYYRSVKSLKKDTINELFDAANKKLNGTTDTDTTTDTDDDTDITADTDSDANTDTTTNIDTTTTTTKTVEYIDIPSEDISKYYNWQEINRIGIDETGQLYSNGAQDLRVTTKYGIVPAFGTHNHYGFGLESQNYTSGYGRDQLLKVFADSYQEEAEQRETLISGGDELSRGIRVFSSGADGGSSLWYSDTQNSKDNITSFVTADANGVTISSNNNIAFNLNGVSYNLSDIIEGMYSGESDGDYGDSGGGATSNNSVISDKMTKLKTVSIGTGHGTAYDFIKMSSISDSSVAGRMKKLWQEGGSKTDGGYCTYNGRYLIGLTPHCATGNGKTSGNISWFTKATTRNKYSPRYIDIVFKDGKVLKCIWCKSITGTNKFGSNKGTQTVTFITSGSYKKPKDTKSSLHWVKGKKVNKVISYKLTTTQTGSASGSSASTSKTKTSNANANVTKGQKVLAVAKKHLDLWNNHSKKVDKYTYTKWAGKMPKTGSLDYAYCAAFVTYCIAHAGVGHPNVKYRSCDNFIGWAKKNKYYKKLKGNPRMVKGIQPGDIIFYTPTKAGKTSTHVAICYKAQPNGWHNQIGANDKWFYPKGKDKYKKQVVCKQDRTKRRGIVGIARIGGFSKKNSSKAKVAAASLNEMAINLASEENFDEDIMLFADDAIETAAVVDNDTIDNDTIDNDTIDLDDIAIDINDDDDDDGYIEEEGDPGDADDDDDDYDEEEDVINEEDYSLGLDSDGQPYTVYGSELPTVLPSLIVTKNDIVISTQEQSLTNSTSNETNTSIQIENDSAISHGITLNTNYSGCLSLRDGIIKTSKAPLHTMGGLIVQSNFKIYTNAQFFTSITLDNNDADTQPILQIGTTYDVDREEKPAAIYVGNEGYLNGLIVSNGDIQAKKSLSIGNRSIETDGNLYKSSITIESNSDQYGTIKFHGKRIGTDEITKKPIYSDTYELTYDKMAKLNKLLALSDEAVDKLLELLS